MKRKTYPLRISPEVLSAIQRWADDDLRSMNAQIEFVLRDSLRKAGRLSVERPTDSASDSKTQESN